MCGDCRCKYLCLCAPCWSEWRLTRLAASLTHPVRVGSLRRPRPAPPHPGNVSQREHQALHGRKAERDRQAAALAKRLEVRQEQCAGAERDGREREGEGGGTWVGDGKRMGDSLSV
jgi:hypothetical protein